MSIEGMMMLVKEQGLFGRSRAEAAVHRDIKGTGINSICPACLCD
jgi:hypothetical protein